MKFPQPCRPDTVALSPTAKGAPSPPRRTALLGSFRAPTISVSNFVAYPINFNCHLTQSAPTFPTSPNTSPLPFTQRPLARYESLGKGRPRSRSAREGERILRGRGEGPARGGGPPALYPPGLPPDRCPLRRTGSGERVPRPAPRPPGGHLRRGVTGPPGGNNPPSGFMPPRSTISLSRATPSHPPVLKWRAGKEDGRTSTETFFLLAYMPFFLKGFPCESRKNIVRV